MSSFNFFSLGGFLLRKNQAFQGYVRTSCYLHSFAPLRNWLRQPLQSLPRFVNQILEIEPIKYLLIHFLEIKSTSNIKKSKITLFNSRNKQLLR